MDASSHRVVVSISGRIGAGKTTLARALCGRFSGSAYIGIGDRVRAEALRRGVPLERERLQELGQLLIAEGGGDAEFIGRLVRDAPGSALVIVDGVRALEMLDAVDEMAPASRAFHAHVEVNDQTRLQRLAERGESVRVIAAADAHASESAIELLRAHADLVVPGDDLERSLAAIVSALGYRGSEGSTTDVG